MPILPSLSSDRIRRPWIHQAKALSTIPTQPFPLVGNPPLRQKKAQVRALFERRTRICAGSGLENKAGFAWWIAGRADWGWALKAERSLTDAPRFAGIPYSSGLSALQFRHSDGNHNRPRGFSPSVDPGFFRTIETQCLAHNHRLSGAAAS